MKPSHVVLAVLMGMTFLGIAIPAQAASFTGPSVYPTPSSVPSGGSVQIVLGSQTQSTQPSVLAGWCSSATGPFEGYTLTTLRVTTPSGTVYLLGTSAAALSNSNPLVVGLSDVGEVVPFGPGQGSLSISSGTFTWRTGGHAVTLPTDVTQVSGTYVVDGQGYTKCGSSEVVTSIRFYFDIRTQFSVPEFGVGSMLVVAVSLVGLAAVRKITTSQINPT